MGTKCILRGNEMHFVGSKKLFVSLYPLPGSVPKEHSCEIISKSVHGFSSRNRFKLISIYRPGGHFVQHSGIV